MTDNHQIGNLKHKRFMLDKLSMNSQNHVLCLFTKHQVMSLMIRNMRLFSLAKPGNIYTNYEPNSECL